MSRNGKIARLPLAVREQINRKLQDNRPGPEILDWVNDDQKLKGSDAITPQNLSEWRAGGFADWLEEQDKMDRVKKLSEYAFRLAQSAGSPITSSAAAIAGGQVLEILEGLDVEEQKLLMKEKPENYLVLLDRVSRLQKTATEQRVADQNDERLKQNERKLALEEQRFRRQTCELFLKWFDDKRAQEIADGKSAKAIKIEQLKLLMFGEDPTSKK
jgi:hypothetical protein